jgi:hypothetical protein
MTNDNFPTNNTAQQSDILEYVRGMSADLERLSQRAGLDGLAACLRAVILEAKRAKNEDRLLKLGVTPDRRLG